MVYVAFVFAIFGLMAYLEISGLKKRVDELERTLSKQEGTSYYNSRKSLSQIARSYIGKPVSLTMKEGHMDPDIISYGNTKHGSNTIMDVDEDWVLIRIKTPKGEKEKLIRLESIQTIGETQL